MIQKSHRTIKPYTERGRIHLISINLKMYPTSLLGNWESASGHKPLRKQAVAVNFEKNWPIKRRGADVAVERLVTRKL